MSDIYTKEKRSEIMSKISGKNTKPELLFRKALFKEGLRYRINVKYLSGKPDIVLSKYRTIIFINGCFWHGHSCKAAKLPETRKEFWEKKISDNIIRDNKNVEVLENDGWKVIIVWQCLLKNQNSFKSEIDRVIQEIKRIF